MVRFETNKMRYLWDLVELGKDIYSSLLRIVAIDRNQTKLTNFDGILQDCIPRMGLTWSLVRSITAPVTWDCTYAELDIAVRRVGTVVLGKIIDKISKLMFPFDPNGLRTNS